MDDAFILQFNGLGPASMYVENVLQEIVKCEQEKALQLSSISLVLIFTGTFVIFLCIIVLVAFSSYVQTRLNLLWNQIKTVSIDRNNDLREKCIERLDRTHNEVGLLEVYNNYSIKNQKIQFNYMLKYSLRILFLVVFGLVFYLVSYYIFYATFEHMLKNRPVLLYDLIKSRICLTKIDFWSKEVLVRQYNLDFANLYPNFFPLTTDYESELQNMIEEVQKESSQIIRKEFYSLLGHDLYYSFIDDLATDLDILRYGTNSAIAIMAFEASYIAYAPGTTVIPIFIAFLANIEKLGARNQAVFHQVVDYSKNAITTVLNSFVVFTICFCILILLVYAVVYYPFFSLEQEKIVSMNEFSKIITSNAKSKKKNK